MKLYLITDGDDLDLPVAVADSVAELARITGKNESMLHSLFSRARRPEKYGDQKRLKKYHTIVISEEDDE